VTRKDSGHEGGEEVTDSRAIEEVEWSGMSVRDVES
jgi:hypothetical protein